MVEKTCKKQSPSVSWAADTYIGKSHATGRCFDRAARADRYRERGGRRAEAATMEEYSVLSHWGATSLLLHGAGHQNMWIVGLT